MKKIKPEFVYYFLLVAFTCYLLLDTFVIPRNRGTATENTDISFAPVVSPATSPVPTEEGQKPVTSTPTPAIEYDFDNGSVKIKMSEYRELGTNIYVAEIWMPTVEYLKTAFANDTYGKNVKAKTSEIAKSNDAILAINGDFYGAREQGYVIRNGVIYRERGTAGRQDLVVLTDGSFLIIDEKDYSANELLKMGAWQVLSFGPGLLVDGEIKVTAGQEVDQAMTSNPRTAIGVAEKGHYFLVVSDGRTNESAGLSLLELAEFMKKLGAATAYNLDGGGSATMYYNGKVINNPTTSGNIKERSVSDIVYIGK